MPLVIVAAIVIGVLLGVGLGKRRRDARPQEGIDSAGSPGKAKPFNGQQEFVGKELAQHAAASLTPDQHKAVYQSIARGQFIAAIKEFRQFTGASLLVAKNSVEALQSYPQVIATRENPEQPRTSSSSSTVYKYRAIVSRGDEVREIRSSRLNDENYGQIRALALSGKYDEAASMLREYADVSEGDALDFVTMIEQ